MKKIPQPEFSLSRKKRCSLYAVPGFVLLFMLLGLQNVLPLRAQEQAHDPLEYEVSVKVLSVPFVAVDHRGMPVFDLKAEELKLFVNGNPTDIYTLQGITVQGADAVAPKGESAVETEDAENLVHRLPLHVIPRMNVMLVDVVFNTYSGLEYTKDVIREIASKAGPNELFLLLEVEMGGLKYVLGPEPAGERLEHHIEKLKKTPQKVTYTRFHYAESGMEHGTMMARRNTISMYQDAFNQLKRALKTYEGPKVTYLFSEGFAAQIHGMGSAKRIMNDIKEKVHQGGSVMQRIPTGGLKPEFVKGYAAWAKTSTSAYYEIFFKPEPGSEKELKLDIKCSRRGIRINAAGVKEKEKPYHKRSKQDKKIFAVAVASGLNLSHREEMVVEVPFKTLKENGKTMTVDIQLPAKLKNRNLDMFIIGFDEKYEGVDVLYSEKNIQSAVTVEVKQKKDRHHYFVLLVEPSTSQCGICKVI
jgi:hypothetical protein